MDFSPFEPLSTTAQQDHGFITQVEAMAAEEGDEVFQRVLWEMCGKHFDIAASRRHWQETTAEWRRHRRRGVAPSLHGVLFDYLHRVVGAFRDPRFVEAETLHNLRQTAVTDGLTGLYNQTHFKACLERLLSRSPASPQNQFAVLLLDLDRFKQYNDRCGHLAGDEALRQCAEIIRSILRQGDLASRYGGEEFIILLSGVSLASAHTAAERIRNAIEDTPFAGERLLDSKKLTVSGGLAIYPDDGLSAAELIEWADKRLYQAKRRRNTIFPRADDRQRAPRFNVRSLIEVRRVGEQSYRNALAFDISAVGMKVGCPAFETGDGQLELWFRHPFWPTDLETTAQLRWRRTEGVGGLCMMGLEFSATEERIGELLPPEDSLKGGTGQEPGGRAGPFSWMLV